MASRSRLVQRSATRDAPASSQARPSGSQQPRHAVLPPYQPLSCPLTAQAKNQLTNFAADADYAKYKKHLGSCSSALVNATADANEALANAKKDLEGRRLRRVERAAKEGDGEGEVGEEERRQAEHVEELRGRVERVTKEAERAMRELIDWTDELRAQDQLVTGVAERASRQVPPRERERGEDGDGDEEMPDADEDEDAAAILSPTEILTQARADYERAYGNRTMANRYARNKEYANFKELVHDAAGETEPLPPPTEWFTADGQPRDGRARNADDAASDGEQSDEDIVITGGVTDLKCPLTLQTFREPFANNICKHIFERSAIMEMMSKAPAFQEGGPRGRRIKKLKCPMTGCDAMLSEGDFYEDEIVKRQVRRQIKEAAREAERAQEVGGESEEEGMGRERGREGGRTKGRDEDQMRIKRERMAKMEPGSDGE